MAQSCLCVTGDRWEARGEWICSISALSGIVFPAPGKAPLLPLTLANRNSWIFELQEVLESCRDEPELGVGGSLNVERWLGKMGKRGLNWGAAAKY